MNTVRAFTQPRQAARSTRRQLQVRAAKSEDIYIGKGRYVKDDPAKYPTKDELTGGWAGGEVGLWQLRDKVKAEKGKGKDVKEGPRTTLLGGKDVIYTGKGNYVRDDAQKYPSKTPMTGGFAGGEKGVKKFVSEGDLKFNSDGDFRRQNSPLILALAMAGTAVAVSAVWFVVAP